MISTQDIEPGPITWLKSRRSSAQGNNCVEIAGLGPTIAIRDSKNPDGPKLTLPRTQWAALVHAIKDDQR
jgi:Domain of unknown function (DUF397)